MKSELREAFDLTFGLIAPGYYALAAVVVIALFFFLRQNAIDCKVEAALADEKVRPIAAAFDVTEREDMPTLTGYSGEGNNGSLKVLWHLKNSDWQLDYIIIAATAGYDSHVRYNTVKREYEVWSAGVASGELMARGLYRLGFDEEILSQFPPLSAHEKLELRLSLPREFWPQKWLDEENERGNL